MTVRTAVLAATPAASAVLLNSAYSAWLAWNDKVPWLHGYHISQLANTLSSGIGHVGLVYAGNLVTIGVYLGLFLIPLVLLACLALRASSDGWPRRVVPLVAAIGIVLGIVLISARGPMPYAGNVLNTFGLGPETVDGYHSILTARERASVHRMWVAFTLLGTAGALVLLTLLAAGLVSAVRDRTRDDRRWMLALHAVTSAGYLFAIAGLEPSVWFDRYLLFPIPALMAIAVLAAEPRDMRVGRPWVISAWIALLLSGSLSVAATHDYLSWNRVRWGALTRLTQQGIKPEQIDGGFEFNGWFFGNRIELCNPRLARSEDHPEPGWNDFTCVFGTAEDTRRVYRLTFVPTQGFEVVDRVPVSRWLPRTDQPLYVLKRPEWFLK